MKNELKLKLSMLIDQLNEGWNLFDVDGECQLQKIDELNIFESDEEAIKFVIQKSNEGSLFHTSILCLACTNKSEEIIINKLNKK